MARAGELIRERSNWERKEASAPARTAEDEGLAKQLTHKTVERRIETGTLPLHREREGERERERWYQARSERDSKRSTW